MFFVAIMAALLSIFLLTDGRSNTSYFAIHFAIIALSLAHIIWVRRFNLGLSFSFFSLFFLGVIPLFEYRLGVTYQGAATPEDLVVHGVGEFGVDVRRLFLSRLRLDARQAVQPGLFIKVRMVTCVIARSRSSPFVYDIRPCPVHLRLLPVQRVQDPAQGLWRRGRTKRARVFVDQLRRWPFIFNLIFLTALIVNRRQHVPWLKIMGLCLLAALLVSPIGVPRSLAGALYIPLVMMVFMPRFNSKYTQLCVPS